MGGHPRCAHFQRTRNGDLVAVYTCQGCHQPFFVPSTDPEPWDGHKIACAGCAERSCPDDCQTCGRLTMLQLDTLVNGPDPDRIRVWRIS